MGGGLLLPFINAVVHFTSIEMITQYMLALVFGGVVFGLFYLSILFIYYPKAASKESEKQKRCAKKKAIQTESILRTFTDVENMLNNAGFFKEDLVQYSGLDCSFFHNLDNTVFYVFIRTRRLGENDLACLDEQFNAWISRYRAPNRVNWTCIVIFDQWSKPLLDFIDEGTYENPWRSSMVIAWEYACSKLYYKSFVESFRKRHEKNMRETLQFLSGSACFD